MGTESFFGRGLGLGLGLGISQVPYIMHDVLM